ncbi:hypothetical protein LOOC260_104890 [Paucilactobacillus hokkaidonensis JCM 18461]|uniref:DUF4811 domain-containing protein n=2 Tax=Paucilactobacillus hokkaidonensis TaxID=1193095 RepID=A0A0A1GRX2_9LACO|nr:DUF4811 domain-containing protein [Paucilactobacillus hokkaidonensis]KRO11396.1 hypothetical protein IV59_GL000136 [Paucilactobacillus hokkaidonensis]BAP85052.1 hypothetical protein LOOC260_104890 [Paucilactobacillus hokkaidonensis JCM 18461]
MVVILLVIGAISFFLASMFTFKPVTRITTIVLSGIVLAGSIGLMIGNSKDHFGMEKVETTSTQTIYSASNSESMPLALYKPVGTSGKNDVYIYNSKPSQKTPNHTQANQYTHNKVKWTNKATAKMTTVETRWEYKNSFYKNLYMWSGMGHTLIHRTNTFTYPKTWVKITTTQAAGLKKEMGSTQAKTAMATQGKQYVEAKVAAAMAKNPQMTATEQAQIVKQAQLEFESNALKQAVAELK